FSFQGLPTVSRRLRFRDAVASWKGKCQPTERLLEWRMRIPRFTLVGQRGDWLIESTSCRSTDLRVHKGCCNETPATDSAGNPRDAIGIDGTCCSAELRVLPGRRSGLYGHRGQQPR